MPENRTPTAPATWAGLMDAKKFIKLLDCSRAHFYSLLKEGKLPQPALRQGPRFTRWRATDVQAYLADPAAWVTTNTKGAQAEGVTQ